MAPSTSRIRVCKLFPWGKGCPGDTGGVFGDATDGLWVRLHGSILQEAGLLDYPKYAASPLMNKPTVSIRDLALK